MQVYDGSAPNPYWGSVNGFDGCRFIRFRIEFDSQADGCVSGIYLPFRD
jgi:hypothetical protein